MNELVNLIDIEYVYLDKAWILLDRNPLLEEDWDAVDWIYTL